ncbi:hypothetical protein LBK6_02460 [Leptospira borgpetersenii serovar Hardjo]|nr:hypothetical protein LBK6_02460 [Leptospira borgpetersenii serovar Hardjo]OOV40368.1 hypothetical protein B1H38_19085 [Leptospira borgpetersenii serovar Ballum]AMX60512.1 hypothetical protein LBK9_02390 [Leptospira borgpetersenii serovar Hardjo]AMX63758.1 hypothetical protein LBK30_02450 [Leptospira borgpetersenii serovar Hardjo]AMX66998.1 hypothetical protein LBHA_02410 [Leptospira borgpetersenii serovar Hardjo]
MKLTPHPDFGWRGEAVGKTREVFFTTKSYFLQVKSLILVGTLEKYQFLILMIPKAFLICG